MNTLMTYLNFHTHQVHPDPEETPVICRTPSPHPFQTADEWYTIGIHPWSAGQTDTDQALTEIKQHARHPHCVGIGEIGLDYCTSISHTLQKDIFIRQIEIAEQLNVPIVIHCVKAWADLLEIHKRLQISIPCIIHGFRGKPELASQLIKKNFYLSFGTRFNTESLRKCPDNRMFFETDEDGQPIRLLYQKAAEIRMCSTEYLKEQCWRNFHSIKTDKPERGV